MSNVVPLFPSSPTRAMPVLFCRRCGWTNHGIGRADGLKCVPCNAPSSAAWRAFAMRGLAS